MADSGSSVGKLLGGLAGGSSGSLGSGNSVAETAGPSNATASLAGYGVLTGADVSITTGGGGKTNQWLIWGALAVAIVAIGASRKKG